MRFILALRFGCVDQLDSKSIAEYSPLMPMSRENLRREKTIIRLFKAGTTMPTIGKVYGIKRQRVFQILRAAGVNTRKGGRFKRG